MPSTAHQHLHTLPGTHDDFAALAEFHYRSHHPGATTQIFATRYDDGRTPPLTAAVLVVALPPLACTLRSIAIANRYHSPNKSLAAALLNQEVRTISRVIVHPLFRSLGLARQLVQHALQHAQTPYTEALAAMARVHPFFDQAGMTRYDRPADARSARLIAALEFLQLTPMDLCTRTRWQTRLDRCARPERGFFLRELHHFAGGKISPQLAAGERADIIDRLIAHARSHLLSQPVYYLYKST